MLLLAVVVLALIFLIDGIEGTDFKHNGSFSF